MVLVDTSIGLHEDNNLIDRRNLLATSVPNTLEQTCSEMLIFIYGTVNDIRVGKGVEGGGVSLPSPHFPWTISCFRSKREQSENCVTSEPKSPFLFQRGTFICCSRLKICWSPHLFLKIMADTGASITFRGGGQWLLSLVGPSDHWSLKRSQVTRQGQTRTPHFKF